ncbi:MAG: hypothetical protein K0B37_11035 [Bacteroidales bacterium]|nr:hypothetical protein [Bacteroidales bacterium]
MQKLIVIVILISFSFLGACNLFDGRKADERVARVGNKYLYRSDLQGIVASGTSPADSVFIIKRYIDNWVRQQVNLAQAEKNLTADLADFNRKVENYKNSLIVFSYENEYINANLDTVITPELMAEYYEKHQDEFKLRDHIVQVKYVKLPLDAPEINTVRRLVRSDSEQDLIALEEYCINHAASYFLDTESWFVFSDILRDMPINPQNTESFLRNNSFLERTDDFYRYFLNIIDYRLEGSASPIVFQSDNIKAIILNHRKQQLISEFRNDLFKNAASNGSIEIY